VRKLGGYLRLFLRNQRIYRRVMSDRSRLDGLDIATTPVSTAELETLEIFQTSARARALARKSKSRADKVRAVAASPK